MDRSKFYAALGKIDALLASLEPEATFKMEVNGSGAIIKITFASEAQSPVGNVQLAEPLLEEPAATDSLAIFSLSELMTQEVGAENSSPVQQTQPDTSAEKDNAADSDGQGPKQKHGKLLTLSPAELEAEVQRVFQLASEVGPGPAQVEIEVIPWLVGVQVRHVLQSLRTAGYVARAKIRYFQKNGGKPKYYYTQEGSAVMLVSRPVPAQEPTVAVATEPEGEVFLEKPLDP